MKTQEELNALKEEMKAVAEKLHELTPEELESVYGGFKVVVENSSDEEKSTWRQIVDWFFKIVS